MTDKGVTLPTWFLGALATALVTLAISMSGLALIRAHDARTEARMAQYYYVECIQNGICPEVKRGE